MKIKNIKKFIENHKELTQLVYGIGLMVIIPALIVLNTVVIINIYNSNIDKIIQRQALSFGRSIYTLLKDDLSEVDLQKTMEKLADNNLGLQDLSILEPEEETGDFKITASINKDKLNDVLNFYFYNLAWTQPDNDGLATDSLHLATTETGELIDQDEGRFWLIAMPMQDKDGKKKLLSIKISAKLIDELAAFSQKASVYILVITVLIAVLFLSATVKVWDYALLYKKIKETDEMKDEFISMASHELRSPISSIEGYASLILEDKNIKLTDDTRESIERIHISSKRLQRLVEDLLNVSRIEQGRLELEITPTDPEAVIKEAIEELKIKADEKGLVIEYEEEKDKLPLISVDKNRFKQVLINIIGNAIKYTKKGGVEIKAKEQGDRLEIVINDTGIGMTGEERAKLFEKFYRIRNKETRDVMGTGLGLWITKKIVELMNGKISIDSIKGKGTQVDLLFLIVK